MKNFELEWEEQSTNGTQGASMTLDGFMKKKFLLRMKGNKRILATVLQTGGVSYKVDSRMNSENRKTFLIISCSKEPCSRVEYPSLTKAKNEAIKTVTHLLARKSRNNLDFEIPEEILNLLSLEKKGANFHYSRGSLVSEAKIEDEVEVKPKAKEKPKPIPKIKKLKPKSKPMEIKEVWHIVDAKCGIRITIEEDDIEKAMELFKDEMRNAGIKKAEPRIYRVHMGMTRKYAQVYV